MLNLLPSLFVLSLAAFAAVLLVRSRWSPPESAAERRAAARVLALAVVVQGLHFTEELTTDLHERLGALFGLPGIPLTTFVVFNLLWLAIWVLSIPGVRSGRAMAFFAAWFLAIAGIFNGILHPLLAVAAGEYFPGLITSPLIGVVCVWLVLRLRNATRPRGRAVGSVRSG